jgi:hypothetical protein
MWSSSNNIGWWAEREVTFAVPVKVYKGDALISLALLTPFVYANSGRAVISDREVNGRPAVAATIDAPPDVWLTRSGPVAERSMLRLATETFPALNLGQRAERRTLLEIDERPILPYNADVEWRMVAETWGVQMAEELERKTYEAATRREDVANAKALALELLAYRLPFNWVILKQHRDAAHIDRACYQAVVRTARSITHIYDAREIETNVHVRVHKSSGHPIVETLGLAVKSVDSIGGCVVQNLQPWRPFWMRIAIEENLGEVIAWRGADEEWSTNHPWMSEPGAGHAAADAPYFRARGETDVGSALGKPGMMCQRLADEARRWLREALAHELAWMRASLQALPLDAQAGVRAKLESVQRDQFDRLQAADPFSAFCDAMPTDAMVGLARALVDAGVAVPSQELQRLTRAEARETINRLDEIQLVVESILSDEWENWGDPRCLRGADRKPEQCVPVGSVYGGSAALMQQMKGFENEHGLKRFDRAWWYVDPPAPKGTGN